MSGADLGGSAATPGWAHSPAPATAGNAGAGRTRPATASRADKRVALGDLTNIAGCVFGKADAEKEVHKGSRLKPLDEARMPKLSFVDIELLKGKLLEEQRRRERAEAELLELKGIQARAQLPSCTVLPRDKPDGSSCSDMPQHFADSEKYMQALTNLNKAGEATFVKEIAESATTEFAAAIKEEIRPREDHTMLHKEEHRDGDDTALRDISSRMDITLREMEETIDTLHEIITQQHHKLNMMNERLNIEERKVASLEQQRDELCSEVAVLKSKVGIPELGNGDYSASKTEVLDMLKSPVEDSEAKPEPMKIAEWPCTVEELKGQGGSVKKQPVLIEICDDEETSLWYDDAKKPSNLCSFGERGVESFQQRGSSSCEWFFRGNKLMLSSGMKKHLKGICDFVPPEIPFYLYQMNKSNLKPKGWMRFSAKYTSAHLRPFLHKREGFAHLELDGKDCSTVRIILARNGSASLSLDWEGIVEAKKIKVGDVCAFHFKLSNSDLKLAVHVFHVARFLVTLR